MGERGLPNFFVIGAAKAGTTSLHRYLTQHRDVFMSEFKEPAFFSSDDNYRKGMAWYLDTFFLRADGHTAVGESTPSYFPNAKVVDRIAHDLPPSSWRFILVLRDPVARAYSMYWQRIQAAVETAPSFEEALALEATRLQDPAVFRRGDIGAGYRYVGDYAAHLTRWLDAFGPRAVLVLLQEDLHDQPAATMRRVFSFLGIRSEVGISTAVKHNPSSTVRYPRLRKVWRSWHRMPAWTRLPLNALPERMRHRLLQNLQEVNRRPWRYPPMSEETERLLRASFEPSISLLEELLDRDLTRWKVAKTAESATRQPADE